MPQMCANYTTNVMNLPHICKNCCIFKKNFSREIIKEIAYGKQGSIKGGILAMPWKGTFDANLVLLRYTNIIGDEGIYSK